MKIYNVVAVIALSFFGTVFGVDKQKIDKKELQRRQTFAQKYKEYSYADRKRLYRMNSIQRFCYKILIKHIVGR